MTEHQAGSKELVLTRIFDAPRELVFQVWTDPKHFGNWWGPKGSSLHVSIMDVRPGGMFLGRFESPDGYVMWSKFVYQEIQAPGKLVYIQSFSDDAGNTTRAPFDPNWPLEITNILTLAEENGKTTLTLRVSPIHAAEQEQAVFDGMRSSMHEGFGGTFDKLEAYLVSQS